MKKLECEYCKAQYWATRNSSKYCSGSCKTMACKKRKADNEQAKSLQKSLYFNKIKNELELARWRAEQDEKERIERMESEKMKEKRRMETVQQAEKERIERAEERKIIIEKQKKIREEWRKKYKLRDARNTLIVSAVINALIKINDKNKGKEIKDNDSSIDTGPV